MKTDHVNEVHRAIEKKGSDLIVRVAAALSTINFILQLLSSQAMDNSPERITEECFKMAVE